MPGFINRQGNSKIQDWDHSVITNTNKLNEEMSSDSKYVHSARSSFRSVPYSCNYSLKGGKVKAYV